MKKIMSILLLIAMVSSPAIGSTTFTTNYNFGKPSDGSTQWGSTIRTDLDAIDTQEFINAGTISTHISNPTAAHAATAISTTVGTHCNTQTNVQTYLACLDAVATSSGTVSSVSVVSANGFAGTVATATTTPAITLTTTITGIIKGAASALVAAVSGTDYAPGTSGNTTGIVKSTTGTGALTTAIAADFPTLNQNTTGTAALATALAGGLGGQVCYQSASGVTAFLPNGTAGQVLQSNGTTLAPSWVTGGGAGTVTSVALSVPSQFTVTGSPVTTSGTLGFTLNNQNSNQVYAGPTSGGANTPAFRPLVAADMPATAVTPGSYTNSSITVDAAGRLTAASSGAASGTGNLNAIFTLENAIVPFTTIGSHIQTTTQSLTAINIAEYNCGTSGSTQIRVNQYHNSSTATATATATIAASIDSGGPCTSVAASLSGTLSLVSGDLITVDVVSAAGGLPEGLTVEY